MCVPTHMCLLRHSHSVVLGTHCTQGALRHIVILWLSHLNLDVNLAFFYVFFEGEGWSTGSCYVVHGDFKLGDLTATVMRVLGSQHYSWVLGAGRVVELLKCLLYRHEDLNADPASHKVRLALHIYNPSVGAEWRETIWLKWLFPG